MKISQSKARAAIKKVSELEAYISKCRQHWHEDYPGGAHLATLSMAGSLQVLGRVEGVRVCGHAVVCSVRGDSLLLYSVKQPEVPI